MSAKLNQLALRRLIDPKRSMRPGNSVAGFIGAESEPEAIFLNRWRQLGGPPLKQQYKFHCARGWRFDFAIQFSDGGWLARVAIEIEGGTWRKGRHTTGKGFAADCEKYCTATYMGWLVYRLTPTMFGEWVPRLVDRCKGKVVVWPEDEPAGKDGAK